MPTTPTTTPTPDDWLKRAIVILVEAQRVAHTPAEAHRLPTLISEALMFVGAAREATIAVPA